MPVIGIQTDLLQERLGAQLGRDELVTELEHLGCDVEGYAELGRFKCERCANIVEITSTQEPPVVCDRCGADYRAHPELLTALGSVEVLRMELLAVRPDMFDPGGLARALRAYLGHEEGMPHYALAPAQLTVEVDPQTQGEVCPRPAIACAVVRNLTLDDDLIKVIMKLQENLHWALGRDRKHASIGVYDLDRCDTSGPLRYRAVGPEELRFVPLGYDLEDPEGAVTPQRILEEHPKGKAYAGLLEGWQAYPLLQDCGGGVLSMPPIINSEHTRVDLPSRNVFIDVTGSGRRIVSKTLNVLVTSLLELSPGVQLEAVTIAYPDEQIVTPDLTPQQVALDPARTAKLIGLDLDAEAIVPLLRRMANEAELREDGQLQVSIPAYRNDILHPRDLMEDVAIAYGYHNIAPKLLPAYTAGKALPIEEWSAVARASLVGLGLQEVMTLQLCSPESAFDALRRPRDEGYVKIGNPISMDETMLRPCLLQGLLKTLQKNTHRELPQQIFEIGDVSWTAPETETGATEKRHMGAVITAASMGFADLRPIVEAALAELGYGLATEPVDEGTWLPGRGARIVALKGEERMEVGTMGELHPEVLEAFHLRHPAAAFELDLSLLAG